MTLASFSRWQAFLIHLGISALIAATVVALVLAVWYPPPYFAGMGGPVLLRLLIGVDVVLGPLITLIVFDPAKPRLKYDLMTIAALQVAALAYGGMVMFEARPVYNVFVKGPSGKCGNLGAITAFNPSATGNVWQGNTWDDGTTIRSSN